MTYKTILLHLHDIRRAERLLRAAVPLVRAMDAHLIALSVVPPFVVVPAVDGMGTTVSIDAHREAYRGEMAQLKAKFLDATAAQPLRAEWREADALFGSVAGMVVEHGRCADLIVASQADPDWGSSSLIEDPVRIAMESGRPLLLVPNSGAVTLPPKRITIAWNGRREAARAVFDARSLVRHADEVNVTWINPGQDPAAGDLPTAEICATLARHGAKVQASQATAPGADVGRELLRQAAAFGSDLLVMGCYGHSRLREFVLGGASRDVLAGMTLPVLLSH
ncbi:MAG: universal stress protein [Hyphomicrobiaceae bacterium]